MTLTVDVTKKLGDFTLNAEFVSDGTVTALFGRSGAGKTSLVNMIAGLVKPDRGTIAFDDTVFFDSTRHRNRSVRGRRIGYIFQEGRLFPHYSVRGNLLYGRRRVWRRSRWGSFDDIVQLLGLGDLLKRKPLSLSGGEQQRVAIGRALLASPRLLLMDEPLAALDATRKEEILPYIARLRDEMKLPMIYVSHSVDEVTRLADTVVLLAGGAVLASGPVNDVFGRLDLLPHTGRYEASTVVVGRVIAHDIAAGTTMLEHPAGRMWVPITNRPPGSEMRLRVRARDVALAIGEPGLISIRNRLATKVVEIAEEPGGAVEVRLDAGGQPLLARITRDAAKALDLAIDQPVTALIKSATFDRLEDGG